MLKVNLLPWRETRRVREKALIKLKVTSIIVATLLIMVLIFLFYSSTPGFEQRQIITAEINQINQQIGALKNIQKDKERALKKLSILTEIEIQRTQTLNLLENLMATTPPSIQLTKIIRNDNTVQILGISPTNKKITEFINQFNKNPNFTDSSLKESKIDEEGEMRIIRFQMSTQFILPFVKTERKNAAKKR